MEKHCSYAYKSLCDFEENYTASHPEVRLSFKCPFCVSYVDVDVLLINGKFTNPILAQKCSHFRHLYEEADTVVFDSEGRQDG